MSPSRKLKTDSYLSDNNETDDKNDSKTRYVIKQQLIPGSTSSFGSHYSTETAAVRAEIAASKLALAQNCLPPKIKFGDDDSPGIEFQPQA